MIDLDLKRRIASLIGSQEFPASETDAGHALNEAAANNGPAVADGLMERIRKGLPLPFGAAGLLSNAAPVDDGPIALAALKLAITEHNSHYASVLGPKAVGELIDKLMTIHLEAASQPRRLSGPEQKEYFGIMDAIRSARKSSLFGAIIERANTDQPDRISLFCDLIVRHGQDLTGVPTKFD